MSLLDSVGTDLQVDVPLAKLLHLKELRARNRALASRRDARYANDPVLWLHDRLREHAWSKQAEIMRSVRDNPFTAVQSCHGSGKSFIASRLILWYISTHPVGDVFVLSTAPTAAQVRIVLWRYLHQGHLKANLAGKITQTAEWKIDGQTVGNGRKPADHDQHGFQGVHADKGVLLVLDEACGIPAQLWTAALSIATDARSRILAIGNPDDNASHFAKVCQDPDWNHIKISAFDTPDFTDEDVPVDLRKALTQRTWEQRVRRAWGENNALYKAKVLAEFADKEDGLIPLSWVRQANQRWTDWDEAGRPEPAGRRLFSVDVARFGDDKTAIATRQGDIVLSVETFGQQDTVQTSQQVTTLLHYPRSSTIVDVIGIGSGVVDQLRHQGADVVAFNGARGTNRRDVTGSWGFQNVRSAAWWNLRELLDPSRGARLALPPIDDLTAEITAPTYRYATGAKIVIELKERTKSRLGRSPDMADSVVMSVWQDAPAGREAETVPLRARDYQGSPDWDASLPTPRRAPEPLAPSGDPKWWT